MVTILKRGKIIDEFTSNLILFFFITAIISIILLPQPTSAACSSYGCDNDCGINDNMFDIPVCGCLADGWYDTGLTQTIDGGFCQNQPQRQQEYRNYGCLDGGCAAGLSATACTYVVTSTQWVNNGAATYVAAGQDTWNECADSYSCTGQNIMNNGVCNGSGACSNFETTCSGNCDSYCVNGQGTCYDTLNAQDPQNICAGPFTCSGGSITGPIIDNSLCGAGIACGSIGGFCDGNLTSQCLNGFGTCQNLCLANEDTPVLCSNLIDDDCDGVIDNADSTCLGSVTGTVYDGENPSYVIQYASVKSTPPNQTAPQERTDDTDIQGVYNLTNVFIGTYNFIARKEGYIDDIVQVTVLPAQTVIQDFYLYTGINCKADCTDSRNICNRACDGLTFSDGTCNFANLSCHNRPKDYKVTFVDTVNNYHEITCCEGPEEIYPALRPLVESGVKNLYDQSMPVKIDGKTYIMHILIWD